jgi:hypothetical protein
MEAFTGDNLTPAELELRALRVDPANRVGEASLAKTRWFDYRHMHPTTATYYFAHCYQKQTRRFYAETIDERLAPNIRAFQPQDIFMSRDLTAMWHARRLCDTHGWPYTELLLFAQARFVARTQHQFPRPNQLYGEEIEIDMKPHWVAKVARQITHAESPRFLASQFKGELVQAQHMRFLVEQVLARPAPRHRLLARLFKEDRLSPQLARTFFTEAEVQAAEQYAAQFK